MIEQWQVKAKANYDMSELRNCPLFLTSQWKQPMSNGGQYKIRILEWAKEERKSKHKKPSRILSMFSFCTAEIALRHYCCNGGRQRRTTLLVTLPPVYHGGSSDTIRCGSSTAGPTKARHCFCIAATSGALHGHPWPLVHSIYWHDLRGLW